MYFLRLVGLVFLYLYWWLWSKVKTVLLHLHHRSFIVEQVWKTLTFYHYVKLQSDLTLLLLRGYVCQELVSILLRPGFWKCTWWGQWAVFVWRQINTNTHVDKPLTHPETWTWSTCKKKRWSHSEYIKTTSEVRFGCWILFGNTYTEKIVRLGVWCWSYLKRFVTDYLFGLPGLGL